MPPSASAHPVRRVLDAVYDFCGALAALSLLALLSIIVLQMLARWTGHTFPGATNYAGYFMAAASFLAMAYTLNRGAHIRVSLLLTHLGRYRRYGEIWCFGIGTALASYLAWYAVKAVYWSWKLHDISQGQDAMPVWIPQIPMAVGATVLAVALADHLFRILRFGMTELGDESIEDHHLE